MGGLLSRDDGDGIGEAVGEADEDDAIDGGMRSLIWSSFLASSNDRIGCIVSWHFSAVITAKAGIERFPNIGKLEPTIFIIFYLFSRYVIKILTILISLKVLIERISEFLYLIRLIVTFNDAYLMIFPGEN